MISGRGNQSFALALGLSLALHVALLLVAPNPAGWGGPPERRSVVAVRLTSPTIAPPATQPDEPEKSRDIELGLDAPNPPSPTWLGFAEYLKQLAAKGVTEQAAFTDDPVAAAPAAPPTPSEQPPAPPIAAAEPVAIQPAEPADRDAPAKPATDAAATGEAPEPSPADHQPSSEEHSTTPEAGAAPDHRTESADTIEPHPAESDLVIKAFEPETPSAADDQPTGSFLAPISALIERAREAAQQASAMAKPSQPAAAQPADSKPVVARQPTQGDPSLGAQSDRESDPTSIIDVPRENWQLGQPLAAQGLEIKPRRPVMTVLTSLTAWPRNPLCRVSFDRDGVPVRAVLVQATGDSRVDAAIEASLYRWRASGKQLEDLKGDQTVDLTIRLLINPQRRSEDKDEPA